MANFAIDLTFRFSFISSIHPAMKNTPPDQITVENIWLNFNVKLRAFILGKVKDETVADDLLQEVFIKIHKQVTQLKDENKLQAWVYQVARNSIYDYFRKPGHSSDLKIENLEIIEEDADNQYMNETIEDMVHMMSSMPAEYCDVLCLTELGGMSHKAYAEKTGISLSAAKTRAFRARNMLKDMLMKCCHYQFDKYGTVFNIQPAGCCCCCDEGCN